MSTTSRDWAGRALPLDAVAYVNNTGADVDLAHGAVIGAIANGGQLPEELSDLFVLTRPAETWVLDFA